MRISRPLAAVGLAGALAVAAPAGAAFADATPQPRAAGNFIYWNYNTGENALINPANDRCLRIDADNIAGPLTNLTDRDALVFTGINCDGAAFRVPARAITYGPFPKYLSVLFPETV
ncbi:hypothetical protein [Actinospica robiniae]|uniref:hypothetical protein n=1 Tax=Actinospica robiniae TaxID=304901 RepID=UPI0003FF559E|nr:hypothetical protein [Actinospica robiniae]